LTCCFTKEQNYNVQEFANADISYYRDSQKVSQKITSTLAVTALQQFSESRFTVGERGGRDALQFTAWRNKLTTAAAPALLMAG
jgi:hypothetical protein